MKTILVLALAPGAWLAAGIPSISTPLPSSFPTSVPLIKTLVSTAALDLPRCPSSQ